MHETRIKMLYQNKRLESAARHRSLIRKQRVQQTGGVCIAETLDKAERAEGEHEWARPKG
jgi:hypothetical protein